MPFALPAIAVTSSPSVASIPLCVDLAIQPRHRFLGRLKTPGYSQYLHVIDENHLIGVGRDADEETGLYDGLIVSLFNVSDPSDPVVQDRYEFAGGRTTFSPFAEDNPWDLRDHHAISYFAESGILALPIYSKHNHWSEEGTNRSSNRPISRRSARSESIPKLASQSWTRFHSIHEPIVRCESASICIRFPIKN